MMDLDACFATCKVHPVLVHEERASLHRMPYAHEILALAMTGMCMKQGVRLILIHRFGDAFMSFNDVPTA